MTLPMCEESPHSTYATRVHLQQIPTTTTTTTSSTATTTTNTNTSTSFSLPSAPIPKLTDILNDNVDPKSIYSKPNFLKFLIEKHCFENYDLLTHIESLKLNFDTYKRHNSTSTWCAIYDQFFETDIVNLPADVTLNLSKFKLPNLKTLNSIEKTLLNFLRDSYYEFLSVNKPIYINQFQKSSSTPSTSTSAETCFTKSNNYHSSTDSDLDSNSISSNDSNLINK